MSKGFSNTQRTLRYLREQGIVVAITEHWNAFAHYRQDLFGFIDLIALDPIDGIIGVQSCAGSGHAEHKRRY